MLNAIRRRTVAASDDELRALMHHILLAHRFWIHLAQGLRFAVEDESKVPDSLEAVIARYQQTQAQEKDWLAGLAEADLERTLESPYFPGRQIPLKEALMQVCLHSQGHRAQCSTRLRMLGGKAPTLDFIVWLQQRPEPVWEESA
jgi:uncharacterized damage-inducible protein DinB